MAPHPALGESRRRLCGPSFSRASTTAPNEVLVRVHASSINGFDVALVTGMLKGMLEYQFLVTIGHDLAGVVEQVGSEVSRYQVGDEVFGFHFTPVLHDGTWADYVASPEDTFVGPKSTSLDFLEAGALPLVGVAALMSVDALDPSEGERVLVVGATGGVGSYAVQLAARRGAKVIATARPEEEDYVRSLGAAETIDYTRKDVVSAIRERRPDGIEGLVDLVNYADGFAALAEVVAPGGRAASTLGAADAERLLAARDVRATKAPRSGASNVLLGGGHGRSRRFPESTSAASSPSRWQRPRLRYTGSLTSKNNLHARFGKRAALMCECPLLTLLDVHRPAPAVLLDYEVTLDGLLALLEVTHRVLLAVHGEDEVLATHHLPEIGTG